MSGKQNQDSEEKLSCKPDSGEDNEMSNTKEDCSNKDSETRVEAIDQISTSGQKCKTEMCLKDIEMNKRAYNYLTELRKWFNLWLRHQNQPSIIREVLTNISCSKSSNSDFLSLATIKHVEDSPVHILNSSKRFPEPIVKNKVSDEEYSALTAPKYMYSFSKSTTRLEKKKPVHLSIPTSVLQKLIVKDFEEEDTSLNVLEYMGSGSRDQETRQISSELHYNKQMRPEDLGHDGKLKSSTKNSSELARYFSLWLRHQSQPLKEMINRIKGILYKDSNFFYLSTIVPDQGNPSIEFPESIIEAKDSEKRCDSFNVQDEAQGEKSFRCDKCGSSFNDQSCLEMHCKKCEYSSENVHYKCYRCLKLFSCIESFLTHRQRNTCNKNYQCECGKRYSSLRSYKFHLEGCGRTIRKCHLCNKVFARKSTLTVHYRTHTVKAPYKCKFCNKDFSYKFAFISHSKTCGSLSQKYDQLNKVFSVKDRLDAHYPIHRGEKPHKCEICGRRFSYRKCLIEHRKYCESSIKK